MNDDDIGVMDEIKKRVLKAIDDYEEECGIDMAFYPIKIEVGILCMDLTEVLELHTILDTLYHPCSFCGSPTSFLYKFDNTCEGTKYVCAGCYGKMKKAQ